MLERARELGAEKGIVAGLRTVERALAPYRQELLAEARATVRFETAPGRQLQIDFGERLVVNGARKVKVLLFVATFGHSRRVHVRAFRHERWLDGLESAFPAFGGVPEEVLLDNARALVSEHDAETRTVVFNARFLAFARDLALPLTCVRAGAARCVAGEARSAAGGLARKRHVVGLPAPTGVGSPQVCDLPNMPWPAGTPRRVPVLGGCSFSRMILSQA